MPNFNQLLDELECKNDLICQFLKKSFAMAGISVDSSTFDLLSKKLKNHDIVLVDALKELDNKLDKITKSIVQSIK